MHLGLEGKVVLVTGGTRGIGRAIVEGFLREKAVVFFCARTAADVEATQTKLAEAFPGTKAIGTAMDASDPEAVRAWVQDAVSQAGGIDVVVPNVSAGARVNTAAAWQAALDTDMMGTYHLVEAALPHLERSGGNVVAIGSVSAYKIDSTAPSPYGPVKAALIYYVAQLANVLAPRGMRVNCVSPSNTYIVDGAWGHIERELPDMFQAQLKLNPMGRMATAEEIANPVLFLASPRASYISGVNLSVDGGLSRG